MNKIKKYLAIVLTLNFLIALSAVVYSFIMLVFPQTFSLDNLLKSMQKLPFSDILFSNLTFSAIALLIIIALPNIISIVTTLIRCKNSATISLVSGINLMLWIIVQFVILSFNVLLVIFLVVEFLQTNISIALMRAAKIDK